MSSGSNLADAQGQAEGGRLAAQVGERVTTRSRSGSLVVSDRGASARTGFGGLSSSTSTSEFMGYSGYSSGASTGLTTPANGEGEDEEEEDPFICPACDCVVITGERFSLK